MGTSVSQRHPKRRAPQRAVSQNIRRSGKPLFFGWGAHLTHHEREQFKERIAAAIGIVIALAVIAILGGGALYQYVIKPSQQASARAAAAARKAKVDKQTYATVGGVKITRGFYEAVLGAEQNAISGQISQYEQSGSQQYASIISQLNQEKAQLPGTVYNNLIGNLIVEERGHLVGAKTTPADRAKYLRNTIKNQFHNSIAVFDTDAKNYGMTTSQFRQYLLLQHNQSEITAAFAKHTAKTGVFVHVRHILIGVTKPVSASYATKAEYKAALKAFPKQVKADKSKAVQVLGLLEAGNNSSAVWKTLAAKYSTDTGSKSSGGNLPLAQASTYVAAFRKASENLPLKTDSIIRSQYGFHVLEVLSRQTKKLTKAERQQNVQQAANTWLTKQSTKKGYVVRDYTPPTSPGLTTPTG